MTVPTPAGTGTGPLELLLSVVINGQPQHETDLFVCPSGKPQGPLYAQGEDLKRWRLHVPSATAFSYDGRTFYSLDAIPGVTYHVDQSSQTLYITAPASAFGGTIVDGFFPRGPKPQHTPWGGFFNYDILGSHAIGETTVNGLFEAGLFNDWGVGTSTFLEDKLGRSGSHLVRLDTAWRHDSPADMTTLTVGDYITRGGMVGLDTRAGGVQFGTNFSTRPYFVTFPMPGLRGEARVPSTVDLYINGVLKSSQQVPAGPFSVPEVPVVTGPGQATLVVRDALGREQAITTSFYASSRLLKSGLNDYSVSLGKLRYGYGSDSNDYRGYAATGLFRHGFNQHFTGELHGEVSNQVRDFTLGGTYAATDTGAVSTAVGVSNSHLGTGVLGQFGLQRIAGSFTFGANVQLASPHYTSVGYNGLPAPRKQVTATAGTHLGSRGGSVYASYLDQDSPLFGHVSLVTAGYSLNFGNGAFVNLNAFHTISGTPNNGLTLTLSFALGVRQSLTTGTTYQNGETRGFAQLQKSLPQGTGSGYQVYAETGQNAVPRAEFDYQNQVGTYRVGVAHVGGGNAYQGEWSGGLAFIGGGVYPTRHIDQSFGLAEVPGVPGVTVYSENQPVAVTGKDGYALIPRLNAYEENHLRIGVNKLPLGAQVDTLKLDAVPRYRSGLIERFPVTETRGATFTVHLADGEDLPSGAAVRVIGHSESFPVGLNGEVYVTGLSAHNIVEATWDQQSCRFTVNMPRKSQDPIPDLGEFTCEGIHL